MPACATRTATRSARRALGVVALAAIAGRALAQQSDRASAKAPASLKDSMVTEVADPRFGKLPARWEFGVGGYLPRVAASAEIGTDVLPGTEIDFENKLGMTPNVQSIDLLASFRLARRHMFSLEYFNFTRTASKTLADSLIVGDTVYQAGATLDARGQLKYYGFTYRYYIWRRYRWELGAGLGIDALDINSTFGIKRASGADSAQAGGSIVAPVPMLGVYGDWEVIPDLYLRAIIQLLYINNVESYGGLVRDRRLSAEWYPYTHYGLGLGWHYVGVSIRKTGENGRYVQANYSIQGISAYVTAAFGAPQPVAPRLGKFRYEPPAGQDYGLMPRNLSVSVGGYLPSVDSHGQFSSQSHSGSDISLENRLGLPASTGSLVIDAAVRTGDRSLITGSYFSFTRSGSTTLADTIFFGDKVYPAGATVDASGGLAYFGFNYRYYFFRANKWEIGAGIGLDELDLTSHIGIKASVVGQSDSLQTKTSFSAPAPMLGLYVDWEFLPKFYLRASGEFMALAVDNASGSITDDRVTAEWDALKQYGIGIGYHYVGLGIDKSLRNGDQLKYDYQVQGPVMFLTAAF